MQEIFDRIRFLNADPSCHGILVQSPIVLADGQQDQADVLSSFISAKKDVDGLHPMNLGSLALQHGQPNFYPCTPAGILEILRHYNIAVSGKRVAVIGRSRIVGMPTALMLNRYHATVTLCHSQTTNLPSILKEAELVIAAIGKPRFVKAEWIRRDAVIIDVGVNRIIEPDGRTRLVGDVDYEPVSQIAKAITPVPGGVGPMTVAMLVRNLYHAALKEGEFVNQMRGL
jgi:5,10-methylene-tetrahydrofolate dehydrogenase/methenyl tetrahydrofolate cyclohydrolase